MKTIIAPTDFSHVSINAVNYAADMAAALNAELVLLHVSELPGPISGTYVKQKTHYEQIKGQHLMSDMKERLVQRTGNKIKIHAEIKTGTIKYELEKLCKQKEPFAVVMGTHGATPFEQIFVQSTTQYAVKHLEYPVLVVPEDAPYKTLKNIGLALDIKSANKGSQQYLRELISTYNASLHVLHVSKAQTADYNHLIEKVLLQHDIREFSPQFHFITGDDVVEAIFSFVQNNSIDLLIIMPKKHILFHKSETKQFLLHPKIPVITIHEIPDNND